MTAAQDAEQARANGRSHVLVAQLDAQRQLGYGHTIMSIGAAGATAGVTMMAIPDQKVAQMSSRPLASVQQPPLRPPRLTATLSLMHRQFSHR